MSVANVKAQIERFLATPEAEVLCIRGNWGTGKTYNWVETLKSAVATNKVGRAKYAYVSLFGANDLDGIKQEIIHQTIDVSQVGVDFNYKDVETYVKGAFPGLLKLGSLAGKILGENYTSAGVAVMYMMVRKRLICIDDLERKGDGLRSIDVLGLVSQLREDRDCKVVLLLNDERLNDRSEFESYLEKVVDISLRFSPTAAESAEIALSGVSVPDELKALVKERAVTLGIDNVRVIRKLLRFSETVEPLLKNFERGVFNSVVSSIVLVGWCYLQPEVAPNLDFITKRKGIFSDHIAKKAGELSGEEIRWVQLVQDYGYTHTDEFDLALLKGIQDGYFTEEIIDKHATELNERVKADAASADLNKAWRNLHDTFEGEVAAGLERFTTCIKANGRFYSLHDMMSVVNMFRDLGEKERGDELFDIYLEARRGIEGAYDLTDTKLFSIRIDEDVRLKLAALEEWEVPIHAVDEMFLMLSDNGYDEHLTERLAEVPVGDYIRVLKSYSGHDFGVIRRALTQYNRLGNPSPAIQVIIRRTSEALGQIAAEDEFNAFKVKRWGIFEKVASLDQADAAKAAPQK